jgi:preprotein translocase subunit SecA
MNFWEMHDLALINTRQEAIKIIEDFEGKNINDKNYTSKLHKLLNKKLGKKTDFLTKTSVSMTLKNINFKNTSI